MELIRLKSINKKYDVELFDNFSYSFNDHGFYLLYGESGCGKTTLLNIIAKLVEADSGKVIFNCTTSLEQNYYYITQDNNFINYLTTMENIKLATSNEYSEILNILKKFEIEDKINNYPSELSMGEKERVSLCIAVLKNKKILLLDECTNSLDEESKSIIITNLKDLSKEKLIIMTSHDSSLKTEVDNIIDFNNLSSNKMLDDLNKVNLPVYKINTKQIYKYIFKNKGNKIINVLLCLVFVFVFMILFYIADPYNKILTTFLEKKVNYFQIGCNVNNFDKCSTFLNNKNSSDYYPISHNFSNDKYKVLPLKEELLLLCPKIIYGDYFNNENDVILGYDVALKYSNKKNITLEDLIGEKITLELDNGTYDFFISGIFEKYDNKNKAMKFYLSAGDIVDTTIDNEIFEFDENNYLSSKFINSHPYINNSKLVFYNVFYKSSQNMANDFIKYYSDNPDVNSMFISPISAQFFQFFKILYQISKYIYPIIFVSIIVSILFYYIITKINITFNKQNISIYKMYGYKYKDIKNAMILKYLLDVLKTISLAFVLSCIISILINNLNNIINFNYSYLFIINIKYFFVILISLLTIVFIVLEFLFLSFNKINWYDHLVKRDDLL